MVPRYRLTSFVLAGGYCGLIGITAIYVNAPDRYGFSVAEYQRWCLVGLIAGVFAGLGTELAVRIVQRPGSRFTIREFMLAIALVAAAIVVCSGLAKWAGTSDQGRGNVGAGLKEPFRRNR
jgi:hypothetical protein